MATESEEVGIRIRNARTEAGLTQAELAERIGTTPAVLSHLETGWRGGSHERLVAIARACGVAPSAILGADRAARAGV